MGDFADLVSPRLTGHSAGVASLAEGAARLCGCSEEDVATVRRAGFVHDLGRVAVPAGIWEKPDPLLVPAAAAHHERSDGSGYHRGATAASLPLTARLVAAADTYRTKTEDWPHRSRLSPADAAAELVREVERGRQDATAVAAVLEAAGHPAPPLRRPAGLTEREAQVLGMLARGLQTKQVARLLGISVKTADRHVQNAYAKAGVSTRASATMFAMEHGLTAWGELPMASAGAAS